MWFHCRLYQLPPRSAVICWSISWGQCCGSKKLPSSDTSPQIHSGSRVLFCQPLGMRHEGQVCDAERYKIAPGSSVAGNCYSCSYLGSGKLIQPIKTEQLAWEWKFLCCVFGSSTPNRLWMGMSLLSPRKCQSLVLLSSAGCITTWDFHVCFQQLDLQPFLSVWQKSGHFRARDELGIFPAHTCLSLSSRELLFGPSTAWFSLQGLVLPVWLCLLLSDHELVTPFRGNILAAQD